MIKKTTAIAALTLFGLIGCGAAVLSPYEHFMAGKPWLDYPYKTGATPSSTDRDTLNCRVESHQRVSQQLVTNTTPSFTTDTQTYCNKIGTQVLCNTTGGDTIGGDTYTTDVNAGLRRSVERQCMMDKNYRYVNIPPCPEGVVMINMGADGNYGYLPLSNTTCYRVLPDNRSGIGNY